MQVNIKYFASLRELMGETSTQVDIEENLSVNDLWQLLTSRKNVGSDTVMMAVNAEYVGPDYQLQAGDEVAFFPPVTGG